MPTALRRSSARDGEKPGDRAGDRHELLLVDRDAVGRAGDRLEALVVEGDRRWVPLVSGIGRDERHRPGPVQGDQRDEVRELGRADLAQRVTHPARLELEHAERIATGEHLVRGRIVERNGVDVDSFAGVTFDERHAVLDHVEVAKPKEVHLEQSEGLDVVVGQLGHDVALVVDPDRQEVGHRPRRDHDAGRMYALVADEPLQRTGGVDDLLGGLLGLVRDGELGAGLEGVLELHADRALGHHLRDPVDLPVRVAEHAPRVADDGAGQELAEGADPRDGIRPVLLGDVADDRVASTDREVGVDVRHALAPGVEEPLEEQPMLDRVEVGDAQRERDERAGRGATARADGDAVVTGPADVVPDDQEVAGEAHLVDDVELEAQPLLGLGTPDLAVAAIETLAAEPLQVRAGRLARRHRKAREPGIAQRQLEATAATGHLERGRQRLRIVGQRTQHLLGGLEVELLRVELEPLRVRQDVAGLDGQERLVGVGVGVAHVVDVAGRDERPSGLLAEPREVRVDPPLLLDPGVLQLEVDVLRSEDLAETVELPRAWSRSSFSRCEQMVPDRHPESTMMPSAYRLMRSWSMRGRRW